MLLGKIFPRVSRANCARAMGSLVHPIRAAPRADRFPVLGFHSVEFWCGDAAAVWRRFSLGLGLPLVAQSDQTTGNSAYASYVLRRVFRWPETLGRSFFSQV